MDHTKIDPADPKSPCQELFVRSLGFVVHSPFGSLANELFVCVYKESNPAVDDSYSCMSLEKILSTVFSRLLTLLFLVLVVNICKIVSDMLKQTYAYSICSVARRTLHTSNHEVNIC